MIISFEGIDNAGKTTLAIQVVDHLKDLGYNVFLSKELTTDIGQLIKSNIKQGSLSPIMKSFLFAADRQIRIENLSNCFDNSIVIFDRYLYSAIVYRELEGIDGEWIQELNKYIPKSDLNLYIDISPEESIKRTVKSKFNINYSLDQLSKARSLYNKYVDNGELVFINGMRDYCEVYKEVITIIEKMISK